MHSNNQFFQAPYLQIEPKNVRKEEKLDGILTISKASIFSKYSLSIG
jgi:hypothetical protein